MFSQVSVCPQGVGISCPMSFPGVGISGPVSFPGGGYLWYHGGYVPGGGFEVIIELNHYLFTRHFIIRRNITHCIWI